MRNVAKFAAGYATKHIHASTSVKLGQTTMPIRMERVTMRRTASRSSVAGDAGVSGGCADEDAPGGVGGRTTLAPTLGPVRVLGAAVT